MPDSARQNAQHAAPAPLKNSGEWPAGKKGSTGGGSSARSPLFGYFCVGIARYLWRGGGHFFSKSSLKQANCAHSSWYYLVGEAKFSIAEREVPHSF